MLTWGINSSLLSASSALLCLFFHTQKHRDARAHMNPHSYGHIYNAARTLQSHCRAQYHVNWDVRVQDVILCVLPVSLGYGFVDFDSPSAAQKAVTALKSTGIQAQMAKVRIHGRMILRAPPLRWTFGIDTLNYSSYLPNSDQCWPYSLSVSVTTRWLQPADFLLHMTIVKV